RDLAEARRLFGDVRARYFHLAALGAVAAVKTPVFRAVLAGLSALDRVLLRVPAIQRYAWIVVLELSSPA
ncbi:MAG: class I SAM-dependent methyltransferase, partial [Candidatus Eremiobacteraeota bacterium]|nr:class I SAM-dependent methyltransferase [Candidatus Eremiobacteraeota bacterium]